VKGGGQAVQLVGPAKKKGEDRRWSSKNEKSRKKKKGKIKGRNKKRERIDHDWVQIDHLSLENKRVCIKVDVVTGDRVRKGVLSDKRRSGGVSFERRSLNV